MLGLSGSVNVYGNLLTNGFTYSTETGVYTYRPENINGNWDANVAASYTFSWGKMIGSSWRTKQVCPTSTVSM